MYAYWLNSRYSIFLALVALFAVMLCFCMPNANATDKVARVRVIAVSLNEQTEEARAFRQGLRDAGYTEGRDVIIEWWFGGGHYDRLPEAVADLGQKNPLR